MYVYQGLILRNYRRFHEKGTHRYLCAHLGMDRQSPLNQCAFYMKSAVHKNGKGLVPMTTRLRDYYKGAGFTLQILLMILKSNLGGSYNIPTVKIQVR